MNEKELLKQVSDNEYRVRAPELSPDQVLGTSVSGRARVRGGYWRLGLVLTAAAIAVGAVFFMNRSKVEKDASSSDASSSEGALPIADNGGAQTGEPIPVKADYQDILKRLADDSAGEWKNRLKAAILASNDDLLKTQVFYDDLEQLLNGDNTAYYCCAFIGSGQLEAITGIGSIRSDSVVWCVDIGSNIEIRLNELTDGSYKVCGCTNAEEEGQSVSRTVPAELLEKYSAGRGCKTAVVSLPDYLDTCLLLTEGAEGFKAVMMRGREDFTGLKQGEEVSFSYAVSQIQKNMGQGVDIATAADRPYYSVILDYIEQHPENIITYVSEKWYEKCSWTKNGEQQYGVWHDHSECNYDYLPDGSGGYEIAVADAAPAKAFTELIKSAGSSWTGSCVTEMPDSTQEYSGMMSAPMVVFESKDGDMDFSVYYLLNHKYGNVYTAGVYFKVNDPETCLDVNSIQFDFTWEEGKEYLYDQTCTPHITGAAEKKGTDTYFVGEDAEEITCTYNYGLSDEIELKTDITVKVDRKKGRITVDTATSGSTALDAPIKLTGACMVPQLMNDMLVTGDDPKLKLAGFTCDGEEIDPNDAMINVYTTLKCDREETVSEMQKATHHYELTFDGGIEDITQLKILSLCQARPDSPVWESTDALPKLISGGVVIRFESFKSPI
ncbi:MAG: hypothetical protein IKN17_03960 [Ruminococcus sp.]|nr:hypothetical protein [Ruminococcus sp.]